MNRPVACCLAAALSILIPATASAIPQIGEHENGWSLCEERALHLYEQAHEKGLDPGRNRIDDGKLLASGKVVPEPRPCEWRDRLDTMVHPPAPEPVASYSEEVAAPVTSTVAPATTSAGGCPSYMSGEADSPSDVNPDSGAAGCYQILPSTQADHGCAAPDAACAAAICETSGDGAWVSADPCAYLRP